ncbi:hypothetical protein G4Y79_21180 [Phototrophicus methaneseepsis]|uniref:Uncharacterized protein n=1 Tax=Phototrophicus methaneseepsis TaxID=2710758 RepID=A0A7S8ID41_9CHLR|nr:hypothetical protein [Phototrophicus methaneseepsis]QPC82170.1 hypothetical protein G4Y79_21180 [Phototrophicus methaneseepsis]
MAYLNQEERDKFLDEIKDLKFNKLKSKLRHKDPKNRLAYFRNVQETGYWMTRYVLPTYGTQVTIYETRDVNNKQHVDYAIDKIVVEPTPDNLL